MTPPMHRRDFLKIGGATAALAGLGTAGSLAADPPDQNRPIKKAVMYATIGFPGSVMDKLKAVKAAGFEGVEPMGYREQDQGPKPRERTRSKTAGVCFYMRSANPRAQPGADWRP